MNPSPHRPRCRWPNRPSFTLVELLVAIAILGTLAGLALFSLLGAQTDARVARTRGTIQKLNEIVLQRWEEYRYRPINVELIPERKVPITTASGTRRPYSPRELARVRMVILRDTMRMEMPDRVSDILYEPSLYTIYSSTYGAEYLSRKYPSGWGVIYEALRSRVGNLCPSDQLPILDPATAPRFIPSIPNMPCASGDLTSWHELVDSSELLYLIVATSNYNGSSALEFFRPSEVADTDGDGLLEFVDAWRQPIVWLRWPAGYNGDLVQYADSDAMDPLKTDWRFRPGVDEAWQPRTLVPLIMSRGQDGEWGVTRDFYDPGPSNPVPPIVYATMEWPRGSLPFGTVGLNANGQPIANPHYAVGRYYFPDPNFTFDFTNSRPNGPSSLAPYSVPNQIGSVPDFIDAAQSIRNDFWVDNITNHDIILEP